MWIDFASGRCGLGLQRVGGFYSGWVWVRNWERLSLVAGGCELGIWCGWFYSQWGGCYCGLLGFTVGGCGLGIE